MFLRDLLGAAWQSLWGHRLRAGLSILGIVIGIGSFSIMYSVGEGARQATIRVIKELGADLLKISDADPDPDTGIMSLEDARYLQASSPSITAISPEITGQTEIPWQGGRRVIRVFGVLNNYFDFYKLSSKTGRVFSEIDVQLQHQVCVIGQQIARELFANKDPLAQSVPISNYRFHIIGVLDEPKFISMGISDASNAIFIPMGFAQRLFKIHGISTLYALAQDTDGAMKELARFFSIRNGDDHTFEISSQKQLLETQQRYVAIFEYVLWAIGSISLLVGGIGIMNIMLVSVTERLREIGIRRALGATRREILLQFLCESLLLCIFGALGGALLGIAGMTIVSQWTHFEPVFSMKLLLLALAISSGLGILFGTYPAHRASKQDPTIVLRYD